MLQTINIKKQKVNSSNRKSKLIIKSKYEKGNAAEQKNAEWLKDKYGVEFDSKTLPLGRRIDGSVVFHKFDLVSPDNQIVAEIKTHKITASGNISSTKILDTYVGCGMLDRVLAKTKLLILSDSNFCMSFRKNSQGRIPKQIEIVCISDESNSQF
jgi:hypothetical protein